MNIYYFTRVPYEPSQPVAVVVARDTQAAIDLLKEEWDVEWEKATVQVVGTSTFDSQQVLALEKI